MFDHELAIKAFEFSQIEYLVTVPVSNMFPIFRYFTKKGTCIYATREEEAISIASGIRMAGKMPIVFIQQSGVGNMLNAVFGLSEGYDIFFPILVLDRGASDENPIQAHSSVRTSQLINSIDNVCYIDFNKKGCVMHFHNEIKNNQRWFLSSF